MSKATLEEFGATIRFKYPEYSGYSNLEVGEAMLVKYPQYKKIVALEESEEKGFLRKVGDFFTSATQKFGETIGQLEAAPDVIQSKTESELGFVDLEDKLKRQIAESKKLGRDTSRMERQLSDITGRQTLEKDISSVVPAVEKTGRQVVGEAIGTGVEALSGGAVSGIKGFGFSKLAPSATKAAISKTEFLAKPLSGRLAQIGKETAKNMAIFTPFGYAMDVARNLEEDKSGMSAFKPGMATLISALIPVGIGGFQAGRQLTATALSKAIAPNFSGIPSGTYEQQRIGKVTDFLGKVTPESALDDARTSGSAFKSAMQKEFGKGKEQIIAEFTGKRIGLDAKNSKSLLKIAERFGFDDRLPQNLSKMSAKETMEMLAEINKIKPITQLDDPLTRSLKLNLMDVKNKIVEQATSKFGGEGGIFEKIYADYSSKSKILKDIQSIFGKVGLKADSIKLNPVQHQTATRRLQKVFNDDAEGYLKAIEMLEQETGDRILDKIAASQLSKIMPKSFRVNISTIPGMAAINSGGLGILSDIVSALTFPLSSPRFGAWLIRKIGGYDPSIVTRLLNASPAVRRAIYDAVHKENTSFSDAVELYAKDYLKNPRMGLAIEDISQKSSSGIPDKIPTTKSNIQGKTNIANINQPNASNISGSIAQPDKTFKGYKDLTTKFLEYAKGKTTLSKQEIMDFAKRPELKKGEVGDLDILVKNLPEGKHSAEEIADALRFGSEKYGTRGVLELKPVKVKEPQYGGVTISPIKRLEGDKFSGNYEEVVFESPITTNGSSHYPNSKNYFAHARGDEVVESGKKIWREQEIQSDLLQKEGMESLFNESNSLGSTPANASKMTDAQWSALEKQRKLASEKATQNYDKLSPFTNDRFGERIMRERIKEKASRGYEKYRLPTGETIGKIEGFQQNTWMIDATGEVARNIDDFKVGMQVTDANASQDWIITDILGDGRFKAVTKDFYDWRLKELKKDYPNKVPQELLDIMSANPAVETFDLTGKSNPQYRRYENWGKFLKNKYGGKEVTDAQGNTWIEIDLKKEMGRLPIEAFGVAPLFLGEDEE